MSGATEFAIGVRVTCADGDCGHLQRVVIDPVARAVTHLVVEPSKWDGPARLTPIDLVDQSTDEVRLLCSRADFDALEDAEETHFMSEMGEQLGYGPGELYAWPYYGLGTQVGAGAAAMPPFIVEDRVPVGEVEVRRGERVRAVDGEIGQLRGLIIDPQDHHVTHVLLEEGHLWGKKTVAIPISAVTDVEDGVQLSLTRAQIKDLPPVPHDTGA
jgi:sporulation protein YlmC with PRC-barrel domain